MDVNPPSLDISRPRWTAAFEKDSAIIYALDSQFRLVRANAAWDRFALANNGPGAVLEKQLGRALGDLVSAELQPFYLALFQSVVGDQQPREHTFECSSPERRRFFRMRVLPRGDGLLIVSSPILETQHSDGFLFVERHYVDTQGIITLCAHCRRTRRNLSGSWDWVPEVLNGSEFSISHGLCPSCVAYHYPGLGET